MEVWFHFCQMTILPIHFLLLQLITPSLRELKIGFHKKKILKEYQLILQLKNSSARIKDMETHTNSHTIIMLNYWTTIQYYLYWQCVRALYNITYTWNVQEHIAKLFINNIFIYFKNILICNWWNRPSSWSKEFGNIYIIIGFTL